MGPLSKHSSAHNAAVALQNDFENLILEDTKLRERACKGKKRDNGENLTGIISTWRDSNEEGAHEIWPEDEGALSIQLDRNESEVTLRVTPKPIIRHPTRI